MGFVVAIIGRYGVGKSLLCKHFSNNGMVVFNLNKSLLDIIHNNSKYALHAACLSEKYDAITSEIPILSEEEILEGIIKQIQYEKSLNRCSIVLLPSFLEITPILQNNIFDYVIAVDCSRVVQKQYLHQKGIPDSIIPYLLETGFSRQYYTMLATHIFLNSVSLNHLEWVANQMVRSFKLANIYK